MNNDQHVTLKHITGTHCVSKNNHSQSPYCLRHLITWLLRRVPAYRQLEDELARAKQQHATQLTALRERHQRELDHTTKKMDAIITRCSAIEFRRELGDRYVVMVAFEPRLVSANVCEQNELQFIAEHIGRQVEHEIATAKFIASAREVERQQLATQMARYRIHTP